MSMSVLERICTERDEVRSAATKLAESDDFNPEDPTFVQLRAEAEGLDKRAAALSDLIGQQQAADSLDAQLSKSQRRSDEKSRQPETRQSLGEQWVRSEQFAQYPGRGTSQRLDVELRALPHTLTSMADAMPSVPVYDMTPTPLPPSLLPLVTVVDVSQNSVDFVSWALDSGAADIVPEGTLKPSLSWKPGVSSASLVTVAGHTVYSRQLATDAQAIVSLLNSELQNEVRRKIEEEAQAALAAATLDSVTGADLISALRIAMAAVQSKGGVPNGFTVSAADLAAMDIAAMNAGVAGPSITSAYWGLSPVVDWTKDEGDPLHVGDFRRAVQHFRRTTVQLFTTDSGGGAEDHFRMNLLDSIAEARVLTKVVRPDFLVTATATVTP